MTEFNFPSRFDDSLAEDGVWFEVVDENDNLWGSFRCVLVDSTLPRYKHALERIQRRYKGKRKPGDDFAAELFVELALVDWDLKDAQNKAVSYSKEAAIKYFSHPKASYALKQLSARVEDVKNFQPDEQEEVPEKN